MLFPLYLFFMLLFLSFTNSAELHRIKRQSNEDRAIRELYNSNHPPIPDYESIPVKVVYDEDGFFMEDENENMDDKDKAGPSVLTSVNHPPAFEQEDSPKASKVINKSEIEKKMLITPKGRSIDVKTSENVPNNKDLKASIDTVLSTLPDKEPTLVKSVIKESTVTKNSLEIKSTESTTSSGTLDETKSPNSPKAILRRRKLKRVQNLNPQNQITEKSVAPTEATQKSTTIEAVTPTSISRTTIKQVTESLSTEKTTKGSSASTTKGYIAIKTLATKNTQSSTATEANTPTTSPRYKPRSTSTLKPRNGLAERTTKEVPTLSLKENSQGSLATGYVSKETLLTKDTTLGALTQTLATPRYRPRSTTTLKPVTEPAERTTKDISRMRDQSKEISKTSVTAIEEQEKKIQNSSSDSKNNKNKKELPSNSNNESNTRGLKQFVPILDSENYVYGHSGNFHYSYEGGDGTKAFSQGVLKSSDDGAGEAVEGSFSYTDKDGNDFNLSYTADENGYRPVGAHLPTPPPIPPAIQRALAYLATKTTPAPVTEKIKA